MIEMTHPDLDETVIAATPGQARAYATAGWQPVDPSVVLAATSNADESAQTTNPED